MSFTETLKSLEEMKTKRIEELQSRIARCECTIDELERGVHELSNVEAAIQYQRGQILAYTDEINFWKK